MFFKRIFRDFKVSKVRYFFIFLILAVGLAMVTGNIMAANSVIDQMKDYKDICNMEDGEFTTFFELTDENIEKIKGLGAKIEKEFYLEYEQEDESILRVFANRKNINLLQLMEGELAGTKDEVVVENRYAETHSLEVGDKLEVAGKKLEVTGIGTVPDYITIKRNISDLNSNHDGFGLLFVTGAGYNMLMKTGNALQSQAYQYVYTRDNEKTDFEIKNYIEEIEISEEYQTIGLKNNLLGFVKTAENSRITGYEDNVNATASVCIMMGIFLAVLLAFIISIFITHSINQDSVVIGTLYALGVKEGSLLKQYTLLPVLVIFFGGVVGEIIGYILCGVSIATGAASYSYPDIVPHFYGSSIVFGVVIPTLFGLLINILIIHKKLKMEPLDLLHKKSGKMKASKITNEKKKFITAFRVRQLLREKAIYICLFIGVFYSVYIMLFGFTIYSAMENYVDDCTDDVKWNYMYSLKSMPEKLEDDAEYAYLQKMSGYNVYADTMVKVSVIGLGDNSRYFDFDIDCEGGEIIISSCAAKKFAWAEGDYITLNVDENGTEKEFKIKKIVPYSAGLFAFLPVEELQNICKVENGHYNLVFSEDGLDSLDSTNIWNISEKKDIEASGEALMENMSLTIVVLLAASVVIYIAVLYLLLKQVIEKSAFSISLLKIFGYQENIIRKIFLDFNCVIVFGAAALSVIFGKPVLDEMYPSMITDIELGLDTTFTVLTYVIIIGIIVVSYLGSMIMLNRRLNGIDYTEVLKNRE